MTNAAGTIPETWTQATIGDVCSHPQYGYTTKAAKNGDLQLLRTTDITSGKISWETVPYCSENPDNPEAYLLEDGDIVVSRAGSIGVSHLVSKPRKAVFASYLIRFRPFIDRRFFRYFLGSPDYWAAIADKKLGVAVPNVNATKLKAIPVPVPPEREQTRIVARIEKLFSKLDKGVESLKTAREQLKVYRQSILKYAFEGKLTAQWRKENKDKLEKPEQLLARIRQERSARYERQLQEWRIAVKEWEGKGKSGKKPAKLKEISQLSLAEMEILPSLSGGWSYLHLGLVINEPKYGTSKKCDYNYEGTGVLRIPNIVRGVVDASDLKGAHFDEDEKRTYALRNGDILVIRSNGSISIVGKCAIISKSEEQYLYAGYLIRLRSNPVALLPDYLAVLLSSHLLRTQIEHKAKSTSGVNNINSGEIQSLIVPLCNLSEQEVVVERLSASLSAIDAIEAEIDNQLLKADALRQSVLKKAFAGQLVAQDPNDEPASVLLDRIKAEKASKSRESTTRTRKKRTVA